MCTVPSFVLYKIQFETEADSPNPWPAGKCHPNELIFFTYIILLQFKIIHFTSQITKNEVGLHEPQIPFHIFQ
jgi:hypothetical protein